MTEKKGCPISAKVTLPEGWLIIRDRLNWSLYRPTDKQKRLVGHYPRLSDLLDALVEAKLADLTGELTAVELSGKVHAAKEWARHCRELMAV